MGKVIIDSKGIKRAVKKYDYKRAIAEYIWNGFDANATIVKIIFSSDSIGNISEFSIEDNGDGISYPNLEEKFRPFLRSEKEINPDQARNSSAVHGINGVGRLTFFTFSTAAIWQTVFSENSSNKYYEIRVNADSLDDFDPTLPKITTDPTGTRVTFKGIQILTSEHFESEIKEFIIHEFCWFLALHSMQDYRIYINEYLIDISEEMEYEENFEFIDNESGYEFNGRFIQWNKKLSEYSRYYFLDTTYLEKYKRTTTLNNKGDSFYHSLYIQSQFFDNVDYIEDEQTETKGQLKFQFQDESDKEILSRIMEYVDGYLREKRAPFIKKLSIKLVDEYSQKGVFPEFNLDPWNQAREEEELKTFVKELYIVEPKIFSSLNDEQQKTFVHLLNLVMDTEEKDALLEIIDQVVSLSPDERKQLTKVLKTAKLSNITKTITLIQDRVKAINELEQLIDRDFKAGETKHIQKFIEAHYWLFGEQYHLVTAEEPAFEEALRRYWLEITGENKKHTIDHPDRKKEMDIFAVRKLWRTDELENIVVELKRPTVLLGEDEVSQIKKYMRVIQSDDKFNGSNTKWTFFLVGNKFNNSKFVENELESHKHLGERFLVHSVDNLKIYVMRWSEVITNFEIRYTHLINELELEREKLINVYNSPDEVIENIPNNYAGEKILQNG